MAVAPTGAIFKSLIFDGEDSRNYGVYITGQAVYNAPERDVEMISIPGRSGSFALDKGRFQNIEVTYSAGIFADNETDFAEAISDFRNLLCSRKGYVRLTDEYNPEEYRMAVYKSGLDVSPKQLKAGEFDIVFDCKPQRFMLSGETAVNITSGDTITNPTLFESSPMLEATGYGDINLGSETVTIEDSTIGTIQLTQKKVEQNTNSTTITCTASLPTGSYQDGDRIYASGVNFQSDGNFRMTRTGYIGNSILGSVWWENISFTAGTPYTFTETYTNPDPINIWQAGGDTLVATGTLTRTATYSYNGTDTLTVSINATLTGTATQYLEISSQQLSVFALYVDSTKRVVDGTIFIDLDIGEAWVEDNGEISPANNVVIIPAELPKLKSGVTEITYDNSVESLKITPRWWTL